MRSVERGLVVYSGKYDRHEQVAFPQTNFQKTDCDCLLKAHKWTAIGPIPLKLADQTIKQDILIT